jgi:hypothetical protein
VSHAAGHRDLPDGRRSSKNEEGGRNTGIPHATLDDLVVRHEALRTAIGRDEDQRDRRVLPPTTTERS